MTHFLAKFKIELNQIGYRPPLVTGHIDNANANLALSDEGQLQAISQTDHFIK